MALQGVAGKACPGHGTSAVGARGRNRQGPRWLNTESPRYVFHRRLSRSQGLLHDMVTARQPGLEHATTATSRRLIEGIRRAPRAKIGQQGKPAVAGSRVHAASGGRGDMSSNGRPYIRLYVFHALLFLGGPHDLGFVRCDADRMLRQRGQCRFSGRRSLPGRPVPSVKPMALVVFDFGRDNLRRLIRAKLGGLWAPPSL